MTCPDCHLPRWDAPDLTPGDAVCGCDERDWDDGPRCAHCLGPQRGYGQAADGGLLCHPDTGLDCYFAVTVKKHAMPCDDCLGTHVVEDTTVPFGELQATRKEA